MSQPIAFPSPTVQYVDYSAEIPEMDSDTIESVNFWGSDEGLTFAEFLDVINPLQHLPVISSIYRAVTGDEISLGARLLGGALFGGPLGILTAGVNAAFEEMSGGNFAEHAVALFEEITGTDDENPQLALEPRTAKPGAVASAAPVEPPEIAWVVPQNSPNQVPAPAAIRPPAKPLSIAPVIPAAAPPPVDVKPPTANPPMPMSAVDAGQQQGALQLPVSVHAPSRNSIALFDGKPGDATTRRISQSILDGQRAQAHLLLASLAGGSGKIHKAGRIRNSDDAPPAAAAELRQTRSMAEQAVQATAQARALIPARQAAHPNIPPTGASSAWFQQAMDRALDRYRNAQSLNRADGASSATGG